MMSRGIPMFLAGDEFCNTQFKEIITLIARIMKYHGWIGNYSKK